MNLVNDTGPVLDLLPPPIRKAVMYKLNKFWKDIGCGVAECMVDNCKRRLLDDVDERLYKQSIESMANITEISNSIEDAMHDGK